MYSVDTSEVLHLPFFLYSLTFPLISVAVRCYNWRGGANSNWTWSNTAYSGWHYTGDTSECSLFMEIPWELRSSEKTWIFYLAIQLSDCERVRTCMQLWIEQPRFITVLTSSLCCTLGQDRSIKYPHPPPTRCSDWYQFIAGGVILLDFHPIQSRVEIS